MVVTILEAHVAPDNWDALESAYKEGTKDVDAGIQQTFLLHCLSDTALWRIITVWQGREVLDAMRHSGKTPRGVLMFRAADAEPTLSVHEVAAHATGSA